MDGALVVGYDGLPGGDAALEEAIRLAKAVEGTKLVLVFAYEPPARAGGRGIGRVAETVDPKFHRRSCHRSGCASVAPLSRRTATA